VNARACLIVEDQIASRVWLAGAVREAFGTLELYEAANLGEARAWLAESSPAPLWLALIDLGLPDGDGVDLIRDLRRRAPLALIVVASIYDDDQHLFDALAAGAGGYLLKSQTRDEMVWFLRRIEQGEPPLSPAIARRLMRYFHVGETAPPPSSADPDFEHLTPRETETLRLLARGLTIAEAARVMGLKPQTVASYVKVIYQKLDVGSRAEATRVAIARGLT